jgi:hypothetical protein
VHRVLEEHLENPLLVRVGFLVGLGRHALAVQVNHLPNQRRGENRLVGCLVE